MTAAPADGAVVSPACEPKTDRKLLVRLLEEAIYLVEVREFVPVNAVVTSIAGDGIAVRWR